MGCLKVEVGSVRPTLALNAESRNTQLTVGTRNKNVKIDITIALVCQVSLSEVELFYVAEGPLIVKEGYFMVKKQ